VSVDRWRALGLAKPFDADQPAALAVPDLLAHALRAPDETSDPVVAILHGVVHEARIFGALFQASRDYRTVAPLMLMLARRVEAAFLLLRKADVCPVHLAAPAADEGPETQPSTPTNPAK